MTKVIVIHGIGNHKPGWSKSFRIQEIFQIPEADVIEISYEGQLEQGYLNRYAAPALSLAAQVAVSLYVSPLVPAGAVTRNVLDYLADIPAYMENAQVRTAVESLIFSVLSANPGATVLAHSLGSIAVMRTLQTYGKQCGYPRVVLLGSPLSRGLVLKMAHLDSQRIDWPVRDLLAIYGKRDLISGVWPLSGQIKKFGLTELDNYSIDNGHELSAYLTAAQTILKTR